MKDHLKQGPLGSFVRGDRNMDDLGIALVPSQTPR